VSCAVVPASRASSNTATAPAAATRLNKTDGTVILDHLFDDYKDNASTDVLSDVKKKLPVVSNPGNWNSSIKNPEVITGQWH
jgi:hypothetical protein